MTQFRPSQEAIIEGYQGGLMGISAVPGSGKTFTLSHLAVKLVGILADRGGLAEEEVLIVTFTNSAVNTFRSRISKLLSQERGLLPYFGYRVRTLHGLAHDIVRMRPGLVGLSETFEIVDERVSQKIISELSRQWLKTGFDSLLGYTTEEVYDPQSGRIKRYFSEKISELVEGIAKTVIAYAKNEGIDPETLLAMRDAQGLDLPLLNAGIEIYQLYEQSLLYRGAIDFDDLIRFAIHALQEDPDFAIRLQAKWPFILEDEAQDSSNSQDLMLRLLSAERNWVRVGDPNQSIFTTFTSADINILRKFLTSPGVTEMPLHVSGRSSPEVISTANNLVRWACTSERVSHLNDAFLYQMIEKAAEDDPQQNPKNGMVHIFYERGKSISSEDEIDKITRSALNFQKEFPDKTVAILSFSNAHGFKVVEKLKSLNAPYEELLRSTSATRAASEQLLLVMKYLSEPTAKNAFLTLFRDLHLPMTIPGTDEEATALSKELTDQLSGVDRVEDFVWPEPGSPWRNDNHDENETARYLKHFRDKTRYWLEASALPVDQLVLTIAQDLFTEPSDLALAFKIAVVLKNITSNDPAMRMGDWTAELQKIADNERRFIGFDDSDAGYEPQKGLITVATIHSAKGLEWDRVYLLSVNNYDFPMALEGDSYTGEKFYIRDELDLQVESLTMTQHLLGDTLGKYREGMASQEARIAIAGERLRLLYVGITRAKEDLGIIWNDGKNHTNTPSQALIALYHAWEGGKNDG